MTTSLPEQGSGYPHPEPYSGEANLERFEIFITGILRWLSWNLLLGSDATSASIELRYLGTRLKGDALEWYCHQGRAPQQGPNKIGPWNP